MTITTMTLYGNPVGHVPVHLSLQRPCDPASGDIPTGETTEAKRFDGVTNGDGVAQFPTVPLAATTSA